MLYLYLLVYFLSVFEISGKKVEVKCPQHCKCDMFENLRRATCTHHNVVKIESNFPQQTQILDLSYNQITNLDKSVFKEEKLNSLKLLNMSHNKVDQIHMRAFEGLDQLKTLDLSYNSVQYIKKNWFWDLKTIEELYLKGNRFNTFSDETVFTSTTLKKLDISSCHISYIGPDTFMELPNLESLDISDNYLISLSLGVIKPLQNLVILNVNNTNLSCNEDFKKVLNYCTQKSIRFIHSCGVKKKSEPEKFQKMINMAPPDDEKNSWLYEEEEIKCPNETKIINECNNTHVDNKSLLQEIVNLSPLLSILVPFVYGISVGMLITCIINMYDKKAENLNRSTYMSFDDGDIHLQRRTRRRRSISSLRFDRTNSIEERQQLPLREWNLSESTPVLFRKNQIQL